MCDCTSPEANNEPIDEDDPRSRPRTSFPSLEGLGGWFPYIGASIIFVTLIRYIYNNSDKLSDKFSGGAGTLSNLGSLSLNGVKSLGNVGNLATLRSFTNFGGFGSFRGSSSTGVASTVDRGGMRKSWSIGSWDRSGSSTTTADSGGRGWSIPRPSWGRSGSSTTTADSGGRGWSIPRPSWGGSGGATGSSVATASASGTSTAGGGGWSIGSWGRSGSTEGTKTEGAKGTGTAGGGGWSIGSWDKPGSTEATKIGGATSTGTAGGGGWSIGSWDRSGSTEGTKTEGATGSSTSIPSVPGNSNNVGWVWGKPDAMERTRTPGKTGSSTKTETTGGFPERAASKLKPDTSNATGSWGRISSEANKDGAGALARMSSTKRSDGSKIKSTTKGAGIWSGLGQLSPPTPLRTTADSKIREEVDTSTSPGSRPKSGSFVHSGISGQAKSDKYIPDITTDTKRKEDIERTGGTGSSRGKTGESRPQAGWDTIKSTIKPREKIDTKHDTIERKGEIYGTLKSPETKAEIDSSSRDKGRATVVDKGGKKTPPDTNSTNIDTGMRDKDSLAAKDPGYAISRDFVRKGGRYGKSSALRRKDELDSAESIGETKYNAGPDITSSVSENADESRVSGRDSSRTGFNGKGRRSEDTTSSSGRFQAGYDRTGESIVNSESRSSERKRDSERKEASERSAIADSTGANTYDRKAITGSAERSGYSEVTDSKDKGARQNGSKRRADNNRYRSSSDKRSNVFPLPSFEGIINNRDQQSESYRSRESTGISGGGASTTIGSAARKCTSIPRRYRSGSTWQREVIEGTSSQIPNGQIETGDLSSIDEDDEQIMENRKKDPCYRIYRRRKSTVEATHEKFK